MVPRQLGRCGLLLPPIGFGAFKIGRNRGIKYAAGYELPDEQAVRALVDELLAMGVRYFDTAPAYGCSESRLGRALAGRSSRCLISTKVGESFDEREGSRHDFSAAGMRHSIERSLHRLQTAAIDLLLIHSDGRDLEILDDGVAVDVLREARRRGIARAIGFSGKTPQGAEAALDWADAIMVAYHLEDRSHEAAIEQAARRRVGVVVKKGLASGHLDPPKAIRFVLSNPGVTSMVIGTLSAEHMRRNVEAVPPSGGTEQ